MKKENKFDFDAHSEKARQKYLNVKPLYDEFASEVERILKIELEELKIHEFQSRAKTEESFFKKAGKPNKADPNRPKYLDPLKEITDLAGVRVIAYFPKTRGEAEELIKKAGFLIKERRDVGEERFEEGDFGYQSIHLLVELPENRKLLTESKKYRDFTCEIQLRTIMQHAWAEIEHDIQYKSTEDIPKLLRRRFLALAGTIELADREFQAIHDEESSAKKSVEASLTDSITETDEDVGKPVKFGEEKEPTRSVTSSTARELVAAGEYDSAIDWYDTRIAHNKSNYLLYAGRSKAKFLIGDTKGAIRDISIAIENVPNDLRLQNLKRQYEEGFTSSPSNLLWTMVNNGNKFLSEGKSEEAFRAYSLAQESGYSHNFSNFNKSMARILSHDCDGAEFFVNQLSIYPSSGLGPAILGLRAIISASCKSGEKSAYKELEDSFSNGSFTFDFDLSQSPLRHLELGIKAKDGSVSNNVKKVFACLRSGNCS